MTSPTTNVSMSGCQGSGDCGAFFPVWPSEFIDPSNASAEVRAVANATAWQYSNALTVAWPFNVRTATRDTAQAVVDGFMAAANFDEDQHMSGFGPNLIRYASGGGTENAGMALAVADMMLGSPGGVNGHIELFPAWPPAHPASFARLLA